MPRCAPALLSPKVWIAEAEAIAPARKGPSGRHCSEGDNATLSNADALGEAVDIAMRSLWPYR